MPKQGARLATRSHQRLIQTLPGYRKPRPDCGLLSRRVFQPHTAKVKAVESCQRHPRDHRPAGRIFDEERDIAISSRPLDTTTFDVENSERCSISSERLAPELRARSGGRRAADQRRRPCAQRQGPPSPRGRDGPLGLAAAPTVARDQGPRCRSDNCCASSTGRRRVGIGSNPPHGSSCDEPLRRLAYAADSRRTSSDMHM